MVLNSVDTHDLIDLVITTLDARDPYTFFSLSFQIQAEEIQTTVNGTMTAVYSNVTEKTADDSTSYIDGSAEATLEFGASMEKGEWTGSGNAVFTYDEEGFAPEHHWVTLVNQTVAISLGYWLPVDADIALGKDYLDTVDGSFEIGNTVYEGSGNNFLKTDLKEVGLGLTIGINREGDADATSDEGLYKATLASVSFMNDFGDLSLAARYTSVSEEIDEKQNTGGKDSVHDGATNTEVALGAGYGLGSVFLALHVDQIVEKDGGDPKPDDVTTTIVNLVCDLALNDTSGLTVSYGSDNKEETTQIDIGYLKTISGVDISLGYSSNTVKDDDDDTDDATSIVGTGLTFNF